MDIVTITNRFKLMSGLSAADTNSLTDIINDCAAYITALAGENAENTELLPVFENAAASLCFYKYTLYLAGSGRLRDFSAGDVSIKDGTDAVKYALNVWNQAKAEILPHIQCSDEISGDCFDFSAT